MDLQLRDKRALVSGSTAGIGYAIAEALAQEGAQVIVNGRTEDRVEAAMKKLNAAKPRGSVEGLAADLGTAEGVQWATRQFPEVDILVNNLGIFEFKQFEEIPDAEWMNVFEVNVMSGVRLSRHYLPGMKQRNWGRIIFVSSESAVHIPPDGIQYGVTKTAQVALARGLAETTAGTAVTVNSVLPGPTMSEGVKNMLGNPTGAEKQRLAKEFLRTARPTSLIQRFADPKEVAAMVTFLASPLASATNGAAVRVEGGLLRSIL
jgi:NAD(P)-dependent dehydrogenase (short-subunit alcohol dehydrogenase family)